MRAMLMLPIVACGCLEAIPIEALPDAAIVAPGKLAWLTMMRESDLGGATIPTPTASASPDDGGAPPPSDLLPPPPPDLRPSDLFGLLNCYDRAYCDSQMFCLRYFSGSPGIPGPEKTAPSCYAPTDPCANGVMDCACIQTDANLGLACAQCFNNGDGTFTCYEKASQ